MWQGTTKLELGSSKYQWFCARAKKQNDNNTGHLPKTVPDRIMIQSLRQKKKDKRDMQTHQTYESKSSSTLVETHP